MNLFYWASLLFALYGMLGNIPRWYWPTFAIGETLALMSFAGGYTLHNLSRIP